VPLYELITDFYAAIINDYLHIYSNNNSRHKLARNVGPYKLHLMLYRGHVGPVAHRCTVELLDRGTDVIGVSCHKEVPGSQLLRRSTETMIAIFVRIIC